MNDIGALAAMLALFSRVGKIPCDSRPNRPCLKCGKLHNNKQPFCSAECCVAHRREKKGSHA